MRLHTYAGSANGYKIELALSLLGRAIERTEVHIFQGQSRTAEFLARSPSGRVPVLELDDGSWLPESNAILWYLAQGTGLLPAGAEAQARILAWLFFEQNQVEPVIGSARFWRLTGRDRGRRDELERRIDDGRGALAALDRHLSQRDFLVGASCTIADVGVFGYAHLAPDIGIDLGAYPALTAWCERLAALPGYLPGPGPYSVDAMVST